MSYLQHALTFLLGFIVGVSVMRLYVAARLEYLRLLTDKIRQNLDCLEYTEKQVKDKLEDTRKRVKKLESERREGEEWKDT